MVHESTAELCADLERARAHLATARAELDDMRASQGPCEVLKLRWEICQLRAKLPAKTGAHCMQTPWHTTVAALTAVHLT